MRHHPRHVLCKQRVGTARPPLHRAASTGLQLGGELERGGGSVGRGLPWPAVRLGGQTQWNTSSLGGPYGAAVKAHACAAVDESRSSLAVCLSTTLSVCLSVSISARFCLFLSIYLSARSYGFLLVFSVCRQYRARSMRRACARKYSGIAFLGGCLLIMHVTWLPQDERPMKRMLMPKRKPHYELHFRWMKRYELTASDPIGFGGYVPPPPKMSLLQTMLRKQSKAAKNRRSRTTVTNFVSNASVCVVLTNYNNWRFVNSTIMDLLVQSFPGDYLIVAVDDFSTDGSRTHIRTWGREERKLVPVLLPGRTM